MRNIIIDYFIWLTYNAIIKILLHILHLELEACFVSYFVAAGPDLNPAYEASSLVLW